MRPRCSLTCTLELKVKTRSSKTWRKSFACKLPKNKKISRSPIYFFSARPERERPSWPKRSRNICSRMKTPCFVSIVLSGPEAKTRLVGTPTGYIGSEQGGQLTRPVMANPRRLILFDEIEKAYPPVFDLFLQLLGEGRLTEQGSGKVVNYTQCLFILTSNAHAEAIGKIQAEMSDYHEMLNAVKGELAEAKVFRPEILGRIDKVYVFRPLEGMVVAEIALLKISKLAREYGLEVHFVAPELIVRALMANEKVKRFGTRELDRILFDLFANQFIDAKESGAKRV